MARVIVGGQDHFNAFAFPERHQGTMRYLEEQYNRGMEHLTEAGRAFMERGRQVYEKYNSSAALRKARAAVRQVRNMFRNKAIKPLNTLDELQSAGPVMQRYLMANPVVRERYHQQRCDGYSDTYTDMSPSDIGESHYDYRRVMTGVVQDLPVGDDGEEQGWHVKIYLDPLEEGDRELDLEERVDVLSAWDVMNSFMAKGKEDPTSPFGSML